MTLQDLIAMNSNGFVTPSMPSQQPTPWASSPLAKGASSAFNYITNPGTLAATPAAAAPASAPPVSAAPVVAAPAAPVAQPSVPLPQPRPAVANAPMNITPTQPPSGLFNGPTQGAQNLFGQPQGQQQQQAPTGILPRLFNDISGLSKMFGAGSNGSLAPAGFGTGSSLGALY